MSASSDSPRLRVFPLGGLGEVGMNCLALEQEGTVMLIDCGVTFDDRNLGVDVIHPDFSALDEYRDRIAGIFVTHGHEDHIGAIPYLLERHDVPIWGPPYALGLLRERQSEHEILEHARLIPTEPRMRYGVGPFEVEPIRVTHSIADATALAVTTGVGTVVHTGDFKLDSAPTDGEAFDVERLEELGNDGVRLLFSDSTNIDADGEAGSETSVGDALEAIVRESPGAVVVSLFASNVHRLRLLGGIAARTGRRLVIFGRSVGTHSRVARATGYLDWPDDLVFPDGRVGELRKDQILGLATGSQGESAAGLARLARGEHPQMVLGPGDTVVLSSRIIPGREPAVFDLIAQLLRRGVRVRSRVTDRGVHVSGHAHRGEQRRMLELVRPRSFIPVHGTRHHLLRHADLARELGVPDVVVVENGEIVDVELGSTANGGRVPFGRVHTFGGRPISPTTLRERQILAEGGIVSVVLRVDARGKAEDVRLMTRGVLDEAESGETLAAARREALSSLALLPRAPVPDDATLAEVVRLAVRRIFARELSYKPMTTVHVVREAAP